TVTSHDLVDFTPIHTSTSPKKRKLVSFHRQLRESLSAPSFLLNAPSEKALGKCTTPIPPNKRRSSPPTPPLSQELCHLMHDDEFDEMMRIYAYNFDSGNLNYNLIKRLDCQNWLNGIEETLLRRQEEEEQYRRRSEGGAPDWGYG